MKKFLIFVITLYFILRLYLSSLSAYGFAHGWNEGQYSLIAINYFTNSLLEPQTFLSEKLYASVPPLYGWLLFASFKIFGVTEASARLISLISELITLYAVYLIAKELYSEKTAVISCIIFILTPWNVLWFSRAQTDPLFVALTFLSLSFYVTKKYSLFIIAFSLAILTKQPAFILIPILALYHIYEKTYSRIPKLFLYSLISSIPLLLWLSYFLFTDQKYVIYSLFTEANAWPLFSDITRVVLFTLFGLTPILIFAIIPFMCRTIEIFKYNNIVKDTQSRNPDKSLSHNSKNKNNAILSIYLIVFSLFVIIRTPPSHEYYSLPLTPALAILISSGIIELSKRINLKILLSLCLIISIPFTYVLLTYTGDLNYTSTRDVANYLNANYPSSKKIIEMSYLPQIAFYASDINPQNYYTLDSQTLNMFSNSGTTTLIITDDTLNYTVLYSSSYSWDILNLNGLFEKEKTLFIYKMQD